MDKLNLPLDVLLLIFEFEGLSRSNYNMFLKKFKTILKSADHYRLAMQNYYEDDMLCKFIKPLYGINIPQYKRILKTIRVVSYCNCEYECCSTFTYNISNKYVCNCHNTQMIGGLKFIFPGNKKNETISIRPGQNGFCCKYDSNKVAPQLENNVHLNLGEYEW